jgi:anti-sigma regulatory factor (Ser/Thr protein kinase)
MDRSGRTAPVSLGGGAHVPHRIDSVPAARSFLAKLLKGWDVSDAVIDDASLLTTELLTNAVVHGAGVVDLSIEVGDGVLHVGVHDDGTERPEVCDVSTDSVGGRGVWLVQSIAQNWGSESPHGDEPGKTVWFELTTKRPSSNDDSPRPVGEPSTGVSPQPV